MIYITGDTHGEIGRFGEHGIDGAHTLTEKDYLIVTGDFGFLFYPPGTMEYASRQGDLDTMSKKPYTILFVDGNHENFPMIFSYPEEEWMGGRVHRIRPNILHLMRGQVYTIQGKTFFTMGGAYSIDRYLRQEGVSFWQEEIPSPEEYKTATANLARVNNRVDVVLTHTAPLEIIRQMGRTPDPHDRELCGFLEWVMYDVKFEHWYFGHWHIDRTFYGKIHAVYQEYIPLL